MPWAPKSSVRGLEFYDGPMAIRRTTFANFKTNTLRKAGGLTNLSPNPFSISSRNVVSEVKFTNANKVWLDPLKYRNDGDAFSVFRDLDGSVTGIKNRMIVPPNPLLLTTSCTRMPAWNAYICPNSYAGLQIETAENLTGSVLTRDDGKYRKLGSSDIYPGSMHVHLLANRAHHLRLSRTPPKRIQFVRNEQAGKAVRLSLDYPYPNFTFNLWGWQPVPKATSLAALSTGDTKYYYDSSTKRLHLRLVSSDGGWKGYILNRP